MLKKTILLTVVFSAPILSANAQTTASESMTITINSIYNYFFDSGADEYWGDKYENSKFIVSIADKKLIRIDGSDNRTVYNLTPKVLIVSDKILVFYSDDGNSIRIDESGNIYIMKLSESFSRVYNCKHVESDKLDATTFRLIKTLAVANGYYKIEEENI